MLVCTKYKVLLFQEDELMKYKRNSSGNALKNENMTLAFNFCRPVNFQAITQLLMSHGEVGAAAAESNLRTHPPLRGRGFPRQPQRPTAEQPARPLLAVPPLKSLPWGDVVNLIGQIKGGRERGGIKCDKCPRPRDAALVLVMSRDTGCEVGSQTHEMMCSCVCVLSCMWYTYVTREQHLYTWIFHYNVGDVEVITWCKRSWAFQCIYYALAYIFYRLHWFKAIHSDYIWTAWLQWRSLNYNAVQFNNKWDRPSVVGGTCSAAHSLHKPPAPDFFFSPFEWQDLSMKSM